MALGWPFDPVMLVFFSAMGFFVMPVRRAIALAGTLILATAVAEYILSVFPGPGGWAILGVLTVLSVTFARRYAC